MPHPFQRIASVTPANGSSYLLAACGPKLLSVSLKTGSIASQWASDTTTTIPVPVGKPEGESEGRPAKKQKTAAKAPSTLSNIIKLTVSRDQAHAVAVTEDKCVRVFSIDNNGALIELSQRIMPKRPCAIEILPDLETIIIGDKFGDVYSIPLIAMDLPEKPAEPGAEKDIPAPVFKPSATTLTVHSQRNLRALESQQKQKLFAPKKEALAFEHKLLLGHVSMLTDTILATREVDGRQRGYIITADRDEHIRVSRGPPQAHIIEGYCLGHKDFVSNICLIPGTDLLVSGGGDDWLGVWDWPNFTLKARLDLRFALEGLLSGKDDKVAVSGLWAVPLEGRAGEFAVCVACEKVPALVLYPSRALVTGQAAATIISTDSSNVLDVSHQDQRLVLSVDARNDNQSRLLGYQIQLSDENTITTTRDADFEKQISQANSLTGVEEDPKTLDSLFYNTANLRKRGGWDEQQPDEA